MVLLLLTLLDGSSVNLKTDNFNFQLACKYGALTVPAKDLIECSVGVHLDDETEYIRAYAGLAHDTHGSRDKAMKFLAKNKRGAYKYIKDGVKYTDIEVVKRCEQLLQGYDGRFPQTDDEMTVGGFGKVAGTIKNQFIEGESDSLGALKVRMSQVYYITIKREVVGKKLEPGGDWQEFGFVRGRVRITVSGKVDFWPQQPGAYVGGANGLNLLQGAYNAGAVIGKINTKQFLVGERFFADNIETGTLYLKVNQTQWQSTPEGFFEVTIE